MLSPPRRIFGGLAFDYPGGRRLPSPLLGTCFFLDVFPESFFGFLSIGGVFVTLILIESTPRFRFFQGAESFLSECYASPCCQIDLVNRFHAV